LCIGRVLNVEVFQDKSLDKKMKTTVRVSNPCGGKLFPIISEPLHVLAGFTIQGYATMFYGASPGSSHH